MIDLAEKLFSVSQLGHGAGRQRPHHPLLRGQGPDLRPSRAGNNRVYTQRDRGRMILILRGKQLGFTLREIKEYLDLYDVDPTRANSCACC